MEAVPTTVPGMNRPMAPPMPVSEVMGEAAAEHGEQQEDHFAGVQVSAWQTQAERLQGAPGARWSSSSRLNGVVTGPNGCVSSSMVKPPEAFDLEAVEHAR